MNLKLKKIENTVPETSNLFAGLNSEQKKAVEAKNGPVLVLAGAGSGKTKVLTHRIAFLIESGVKPWNILALTFTNKAAQEMKNRISKLLNPEAAKDIWAGTFHSIFARILRYEAEKLSYNSNFTIYDADDSLSLIKKCMTELGFSHQQISPQYVRGGISMAKNKLLKAEDYMVTAETVAEKNTGQIYQEYETALIKNNAMDFDDLLLNTFTLLDENKDSLDKYQNKFHYILVDEFQDTNKAQFEILKLLAKARQNICVVGDDAQSIYKWRGADIQNILDFNSDYPYAKVIKLEQNYRSTKNILAAADSVISNNRNQMKKTLWSENIDGEKIKLHACEDERKEAAKVVEIIQKDTNFDYKKFAVLYRTNAQSLPLENALRREKIPYVIIGGMSFYKRKEVKDFLSYLKLLINPNDNEALLRIVNEPPRGLGKTSLNHLQNYANEKSISLLQAFKEADFNQNLQGRAKKAAVNFYELIINNKEKIGNIPNHQLISEYLESSGLSDMYKEINTQDALDRWNNLMQLINDAAFFFRDNPDSDLNEYIQQLSLISDIDNADLDDNRVTLMTLHSAKGLEFPTVIISGMEKGIFPLSRGDMMIEEEEEERRLFYVGITRAEKELHLTYAIKRSRFGELQYQMPSPFISEIDENLLISNSKAIPKHTQFIKPKRDQYQRSNFFDDMPQEESYSQIPVIEEKVKVGDRVTHQHFGPGKIVNISGQGIQEKAIVNFDSVGRKSLMLKYAKLKRI